MDSSIATGDGKNERNNQTISIEHQSYILLGIHLYKKTIHSKCIRN